MGRPSEDELIARFFAPLATLEGADGLRDDAALVSPPAGYEFVMTADALVSTVHFLPDDPPSTIARKSLRVNLSDLAAKGARPHGFLLSLALPRDWTADWLEAFAEGLAADVRAFSFPLIGGDTVSTPGPLTIAVTAIGLVPKGGIPRRSGARPGDGLYVSGTIGDGALGLVLRRVPIEGLSVEQTDFLVERYRVPQPRTALAAAVLAQASASMDVSDGFVGDLAKMMRVSGTSALVDIDAVPLSDAGRAAIALRAALFDSALTGGDDYEILCAVPPSAEEAFVRAAREAGVPVARVGQVLAGAGPTRFERAGVVVTLSGTSFSHF